MMSYGCFLETPTHAVHIISIGYIYLGFRVSNPVLALSVLIWCTDTGCDAGGVGLDDILKLYKTMIKEMDVVADELANVLIKKMKATDQIKAIKAMYHQIYLINEDMNLTHVKVTEPHSVNTILIVRGIYAILVFYPD